MKRKATDLERAAYNGHMIRLFDTALVIILALITLTGAGCSSRRSERYGYNKVSMPMELPMTRFESKITASDAKSSDRFGCSVAVSGDTVVVGAYNHPAVGIDPGPYGAVYAFEKDGYGSWVQTAKLTAPDVTKDNFFGWSVSVSGNTMAVGASFDDGNTKMSGSAYVFERDGSSWIRKAKLTASDGAKFDSFGGSVSVSGDTVVVGAYGEGSKGDASGSVYVFEKPDGGWADMTESAKLAAADGAEDDQFGFEVSVCGDIVVVGIYNHTDGKMDFRGSAYVFEKNADGEWTQAPKLTPTVGKKVDYFGTSVSVSGDTVVVGAFRDNSIGVASGSAYIFEKDNDGAWPQTAKLTASDGAENDLFGRNVSISGDTVVVGASNGSTYVFKKPVGGWMDMTESAKLTALDGVARAGFGTVSVSGDTAVVGASMDNDNGYEAGAAYVFRGF